MMENRKTPQRGEPEKASQKAIKESEKPEMMKDLPVSLTKAKRCQGAEDAKCVIIFMPYKASMWGSMESVYLAAKEDPRCISFVVPLPYYDRATEKTAPKLYFENDLFPEDVPVEDIRTFPLEELAPDIIYIHNPYDDYNNVTAIPVDFHSGRLKALSSLLVYIPYYVNCGSLSGPMQPLPGTVNSDLIIFQSKAWKDAAKELDYHDRIAVLGNPYFDKVIRLSKENNTHSGKKVFLLNVSINGLLSNTPGMITKLLGIFSFFASKYSDSAVLIWRPHPLIQATLDSMRPDYSDVWKKIVAAFKAGGYGIYDDSPSPEASVAAADAYIGEDFSSITAMFEAALKPIFIMDIKKENPVDGPACGSGGFSCPGLYYSFARRESDEYSLGGFIKDVITGATDAIRNDEKKAAELISADLEGTAGKNIHRLAYEKCIEKLSR